MRKIEQRIVETIKNQRDDVETVTYHRSPTQAEICSGYGAVHYADFTIDECCFENTRIPKKWFISSYDGLRYYR